MQLRGKAAGSPVADPEAPAAPVDSDNTSEPSDLPVIAPGPVHSSSWIRISEIHVIVHQLHTKHLSFSNVDQQHACWQTHQGQTVADGRALISITDETMQATVVEVALDGVHHSLLLLLAQDQTRVLQSASGVAAEIAASDVFALAPIKAAAQVPVRVILLPSDLCIKL